MSLIRTLAFASSFLLSALASGQDVDAKAARASFGVQPTPEGASAGGPGYTARFDDRGVEFTPLLGRRAPQPLPVRFTLDVVRRGNSDVFVRTADVAPAVVGEQVRYVHRGDLTEVYDVRGDGIEQSFVFATKPVGTGDLVVRGEIMTELPLVVANDDGVRYERAGLGGVTFGAVTGIDANGATARGSIRVVGDHVEWVLPAAFVDHAAYPLVLDPLIGSAIAIGNAAGGSDIHPAVAFDETTGRYYVVWVVATGATSGELRGQMLSGAGSLLGSMQLLTTLVNNDQQPAIANINATDHFLVGWAYKSGSPNTQSIRCASVSASTGAVSSTLIVATFSTLHRPEVAVGGDLRDSAGSDRALVVMQGSAPAISGQLVQVPAAGNPVSSGPNQLYTFALCDSLAVSSNCGLDGRWLVAWTKQDVGESVRCLAVAETGVLCAPPVLLTVDGIANPVGNVACAARSSSEFVVAWQDEVTDKVRVQPVTIVGLCPSTLSPGTIVEPIVATGAQTHPAIEFAKDKYVLAWTQMVAGSGLRTYVKGLDPVTCATCGPEYELEGSASVQDQAAIASRWGGGDSTSDEALVVWSTGTIRGRRFEARSDDVVTSMGGACSLSGFDDFATYNGDAVIGATDFDLVLANPVSLPLVLVVGFGNLSVPCGSCTIVPTLDILLPAINPYPLDLPCDPTLVSVDLYTQWVLLKPSDCPLLPDLAFSNALRFTIGE